MALVTNNISGSASNSSKIGITGSIIISNSPDAQFPSLGSDTVFFVSGSESAKAVLGGAAKISGSLSTDGNVTLGNSSDDTITVSGTSTFQMPVVFSAGLSGSLTKLTDGTSYLIAGSNVTITTGSNGAVTIDSTGGGAPTGAQYVTLAVNASLTDERVLTAGTGITLTDGGAGSTITAAINDSVVATVSGTQFTGNVGVTGSLGASTLTVLSGVLYQASGTIQQDSNFVWDSANDRLGLGTNAPARTLHIGPAAGASFRLGPNSSYVEIGQANSAIYRWSSGGTATTIEQNVNHIFQNSNTLGFQPSNGLPSDIGFGRSAAGILIVSGAAPGAILRFNAASTPLAAGDLSMNATTGRPGAFIGGAARSLAHTDEIPGTFFSSTTAGTIFTTGSLVITGSTLSTAASTFNLINTAATTVNFAGAASKISIGGATSTGSIGGNLEVTGSTSLGLAVENILPSNGGTGVVSFSLNNQSIFYVNGPTGNITANFTNVPATTNRIISTTVILSQSSTARIVSAVQIDGASSTINWANNVVPTGNSGKQDIFGFNLIRSGSAWKTLGQMTTYG